MATFSWGDTARAAIATCFPCFPQSSRQAADGDDDDDDNNNGQRNNNRHTSSSRREELESLLRNAEFSDDGEMDNDALSLHSGIGDRRQQVYKRQRRRRRKNKGSIRLFGYDLFGRAVIQPDDNDDNNNNNNEDEDEQRRISRFSSLTVDSDPAPVEDDVIARLSTTSGRSQIQVDEDSTTATATVATAKKDKLARKEKRRQRKLSSALLNVETTVEFEGFQGSGGELEGGGGSGGINGGPSSSSPTSAREEGEGGEEEFGAFQGGADPRKDSSSSRVVVGDDDFVRVPRDVEDDADLHDADFDAVAYVRRNSVASRSDTGSGSRSHTSTSITRSEGVQGKSPRSQNHLRPPPSLQDLRQQQDNLLSPLAEVPSKQSKKRSRRSTTSGTGGSNSNPPTSTQPRRSRRSTTAGSSTTTTTSSQPRSPTSLYNPDVHIVDPSAVVEGGGHLRIPHHNPTFEGVPEDDSEFTGSSSPLPSPIKSKSFGGLPIPPSPGLNTSAGGGFPSIGLGGRRNSTIGSGAFLARTGDDS